MEFWRTLRRHFGGILTEFQHKYRRKIRRKCWRKFPPNYPMKFPLKILPKFRQNSAEFRQMYLANWQIYSAMLRTGAANRPICFKQIPARPLGIRKVYGSAIMYAVITRGIIGERQTNYYLEEHAFYVFLAYRHLV